MIVSHILGMKRFSKGRRRRWGKRECWFSCGKTYPPVAPVEEGGAAAAISGGSKALAGSLRVRCDIQALVDGVCQTR